MGIEGIAGQRRVCEKTLKVAVPYLPRSRAIGWEMSAESGRQSLPAVAMPSLPVSLACSRQLER